MTTINTDIAQNIPIVARQGNSFSLALYIKDKDINPYTGISGFTHELKVSKGSTTILLFKEMVII